MKWQSIESAPKKRDVDYDHITGPWILGVNKFGDIKVMQWTTQYPCNEGTWSWGSIPTDYIDNIQHFYPTHWMPLPGKP